MLPAAAAIDWSDLGELIGDRRKPLADATMRRILQGLAEFGQPTVIATNHDDGHLRSYPAGLAPMPTRSTKIGDGVACPAMLVPAGGTWNDSASAEILRAWLMPPTRLVSNWM